MPYRILVVDDLRRFSPPLDCDVTYARSSSDAIALLTKNAQTGYNQLWLDGDGRSNGNVTTEPVIEWILEHRPPIGQIYVQCTGPSTWVFNELGSAYRVEQINNPFLRAD